MRLRYTAILAFALLAGCATSYQPLGATGGFSEVKLADDMYRVSVQGNGYTSKDRAQEILLLRSSELTLTAGYQKFQIASADASTQSDLVYCGVYCGFSTINRPDGSYVIRMFKAEAAPGGSYDAATIKSQLYPKLVPKTSSSRRPAAV